MNQPIKALPKGIQSFSTMIEEHFMYVDKTSLIHRIIKKGRYFFLSRPRRFGKSLLISTLAELFSGNRKLFKSLYIDTADYDWENYPVIIISFASIVAKSADSLEKDLHWTLDTVAQRYGINVSTAPSIQTKFKSLIMELAARNNKVVVLVDEYDHTMLRNIDDIKLADECRQVLSDLFSALKDIEVDKCIRFVFITGITKFSHTSIFSGLNNLEDLTLDPDAAQLLGYTHDEVMGTFKQYLEKISVKSGNSLEKIMEDLRFWYNGYTFADPLRPHIKKVYNPYSVLLYLSNEVFDNYWFGTGTPTFLMKLMKIQQFSITKIENSEIHIDETKSYDIDKIKLIPLLWQTGYLTIESFNPQTKNYKLAFPNEEVKISFYNLFMEYFTEAKPSQFADTIFNAKRALKNADLELFFESLKVFFAQIPYTLQLPREKYYQSLFFVIMKTLDAEISGEDPTNNGRIDAVIKTDDAIWIFEFKLNQSAKSALAQIEEKRYHQKYLQSKKKIVLVGVKFDTKKRNIVNWISKEVL